MSDFLKCECPHCGQSIEYPSEGTGETVPCPTCKKSITLTPLNSEKQKRSRTNLSKLTEETIRARIKSGDTPLHRATKNGQLEKIPSHLLSAELFLAKNNAGETPLHVAAKHGHLDQIPRQFLTKETMTMKIGSGAYSTGSGYQAQTETVLHIAVRCGHADQIPKEFLTPEFLSIEASGYRLTVLHQLAYAKRLDLVPEIYANSEIWNLKDYQGGTPRNILESVIQREAYVADVRAEPATEKQKEKLGFFGYVLKAGMTKGEASDALDECARQLPQKNAEYYNRPATEEQLTELHKINAQCEPDEPFYDFEEEGPLTYGKAKDVMQEWVWHQREKERQEMGKELENELAYSKTEEGQIDREWDEINGYSDYTRDVTREEVAMAWKLAKSKKLKGSELPESREVAVALEELHPEILKPKRLGVLWHNYCLHCRGQIEVMIPPNMVKIMSQKDIVQKTILCPHCKFETTITDINYFTYKCPSCSKNLSIAESKAGESLQCPNCENNFVIKQS